MIRKGTYVLAISLGADKEIQVGALGTLFFKKGLYCYVGSAMNGLDQRVSRHLSKEKKLKWHADYITTAADSIEAYISYPDFIPECDLAAIAVEEGMEPFCKGFGCSDCRCYTHLFKTNTKVLKRFIQRCGMSPFVSMAEPPSK